VEAGDGEATRMVQEFVDEANHFPGLLLPDERLTLKHYRPQSSEPVSFKKEETPE
jgi:hypothetical protein